MIKFNGNKEQSTNQQSTTSMRYERKYKAEHLDFDSVQQMIRLHPVGFRKIFPDRQVNNIYLDTEDLTTYKENVMGIAERKKFRIRWYGEAVKIINNPIFEIKLKNNLLGSKVSNHFPTFHLQDFYFSNYKKNKQFAQVQSFAKAQQDLRPVLLNSYLRSYYGSPNGKFRITIDRHLRYFSLLHAFSFEKYMVQDSGLVIELKYDETLDSVTDRITQHFPFRLTKSSKYVTGVDLTVNC